MFIALATYVETRRVLYAINLGRIELSPFLLAVFGPNGLYGQLQGIVPDRNLHIAKQKKEAVAAATRARKASVKKSRAKKRKR